MSLEKHLSDIREVHAALSGALNLVFMGAKVLALYAKPFGDALRTTEDVDGLVHLEFGPYQRALQDLQTNQVISPATDAGASACRYRLLSSGLLVDIVDLYGHATGGVHPYFRRAVENCTTYGAGARVVVRAITPPFFLLTKLVSLRDVHRTGLQPEHRDAEDIVTLFVEVDDLLEQIRLAGVIDDVRREFRETLSALMIHDASDLLDLWLPRATPERERITQDFLSVAVAASR